VLAPNALALLGVVKALAAVMHQHRGKGAKQSTAVHFAPDIA
jgi:hypothetical protein